MKSEPERVEAYLAALSPGQRASLERLRETIRSSAPDADEGIAYQMPAFYLRGKFLVSYAAFKKHLSFFPGSGGVIERLGPDRRHHFTGKGTLQFTPEDPLPDDLVRAIVEMRLEEIVSPPARG